MISQVRPHILFVVGLLSNNQTLGKLRYSAIQLLLLLLILPLATACDQGNSEPETGDSGPALLEGSWELTSMRDKTGELFGDPDRELQAGQPATYTTSQNGQSFTTTFLVDGQLSFAQSRYNVSFDITVSISGLGSNTESLLDTGTYTVDGSQLITTSDDPDPDDPVSDVVTWSISGSSLTLEDDETRMVFERD